MKEFAARNGKNVNCEYAEGFRQHLGHSYPIDNILGQVLSRYVVMANK
jgi:hypothetical protein